MNAIQLFVLEWNAHFASPQLTTDDLTDIPNNILNMYRKDIKSLKIICIVRGILLNSRKHADIFYFNSTDIAGKWFCGCISKTGINNNHYNNMIQSCGKCGNKISSLND